MHRLKVRQISAQHAALHAMTLLKLSGQGRERRLAPSDQDQVQTFNRQVPGDRLSDAIARTY